MFSTRTMVGILGGAALVLVLGAGALWYTLFRGDAPPPVSLASAVESLATATSETGASSGVTATATVETAVADSASGLDGSWGVDTSLDSFLGYRVEEELASIGVTTAVGRTPAITGDITIAGNEVTAATIVADLTQLASDSNMRDGQLERQAIQTDTFPTSTFELTEAVAIPDALADGDVFTVTLVGDLTLHGVTNRVEIPVEATFSGETLVVVGSTEILFADYDIDSPSGASVVSIEDWGILEIQLFLSRA